MSKEIPFESIVVGESLGPIEYVVRKKDVERYCDDWKDFNPMYLEDSHFGEPIAPPAYRAGLDGFTLLGTKYDSHETLGFNTAHEFFNPIRIGKKLVVTGKLTDKYIKRGLEYVVIEYATVDEDGVKIREVEGQFLPRSIHRDDYTKSQGYEGALTSSYVLC